jgi:hypothetical protein
VPLPRSTKRVTVVAAVVPPTRRDSIGTSVAPASRELGAGLVGASLRLKIGATVTRMPTLPKAQIDARVVKSSAVWMDQPRLGGVASTAKRMNASPSMNLMAKNTRPGASKMVLAGRAQVNGERVQGGEVAVEPAPRKCGLLSCATGVVMSGVRPAGSTARLSRAITARSQSAKSGQVALLHAPPVQQYVSVKYIVAPVTRNGNSMGGV